MMITGQTNSSRLNELRKHSISTELINQYFSNGNWDSNGVDFSQNEYDNQNNLVKIIYYIDGIKYVDYPVDKYSIFEYNTIGTGSTTNFINEPYYKDPKKEKLISKPKIDNDVFIIRQQLSVFERNYLLEHVNNLVEIQTYAGGNYFNIINNT